MKEVFQVPVVLFCFKRVDTTIKVLDRIAEVKPRKLYIMSDEGRDETEKEIVARCRKAIEDRIDWPCEVVKNYAVENRGVFVNIALGARWVFEREEKAVFLEDDNLPEITFFQYCEELLKRYENDDRVLWICGTNYFGDYQAENGASYMFTRNLLPCGWASWSKKFLGTYDYALKGLDDPVKLKRAKQSYFNKALYKQQMFNVRGEKYRMDSRKRCLSWDSQMAFSVRISGMFGVSPAKNQIKNIGVDENSIHGGTSFDSVMTQRFCGMDSYAFNFPLKHPSSVCIDKVYEKKLEKMTLFPLSLRIKGVAVRLIKHVLGISLYEPIRSYRNAQK